MANFLPTFRRKIFGDFLAVIAVFGLAALLMIAALSITGATPPALVHMNYDSIESVHKMQEAWQALRFPKEFPQFSSATAKDQFEKALAFEEGNLTEAGELELVQSTRTLWDKVKWQPTAATTQESMAIRHFLEQIISLNEKGMFARVARAKEISHIAIIGSGIVLMITLFFAIYLSDSLATRLSSPLKAIAEALHARPTLDRKLKLPPPTTIELRILIKELRRLWDGLSAANKVNVSEIMQQKMKLETLLASVEDGFLVLDAANTITHANTLMEKLLDLPPDEVIGKPWGDLSTMNENYFLLRDILSQAGDQETEVEMSIASKRHNFTMRCRHIMGRTEDEIVGRIVLLRDVTERRQREQLRAELIDILSHELKTPVQSLGMAAEMLAARKDSMDEPLRFLVDTINEDMNRIRSVSMQFIQATQTKARSLRLDLRRVVLNELLRDWLKPFEVVAAPKGVRIDYEVQGELDIWAAIDTVKFPWAISNLLSNAIRVAPSGSAVTVTVSSDGERSIIDVLDEGPGIPDAIQRRMYEPFYQGHGDKPVKGLLGVGLTIAKEVVDAHEGRLEYIPRQPQGSIFRISLPTPPAIDG